MSDEFLLRLFMFLMGLLAVVFNKQLGRISQAGYKSMLGIESGQWLLNRLPYIIGGIIFMFLSFWINL
jgi:hypothetical protein